MANTYVTLNGEFNWTRTQTPELSPFTVKGEPPKYAWKTMFRPDQESLMKIMDMQSKGVKNKLSKDEKGYYVNFSRPTEVKTGRGMAALDPPKVTMADGTVFTDLVGNGSKGELTVEMYEHRTPNGGKSSAARLYAIKLTELVPYQGAGNGEAVPAPKQGY